MQNYTASGGGWKERWKGTGNSEFYTPTARQRIPLLFAHKDSSFPSTEDLLLFYGIIIAALEIKEHEGNLSLLRFKLLNDCESNHHSSLSGCTIVQLMIKFEWSIMKSWHSELWTIDSLPANDWHLELGIITEGIEDAEYENRVKIILSSFTGTLENIPGHGWKLIKVE